MIRPLRRYRRHVSLFLIAMMSAWQISYPLQAVTLYWDGSSSAAWNVTANWNLAANGTGAAPTSTTTATDDLYFFATGAVNTAAQTLGANRVARSLTFGPQLTSALAISGNTLTLTPTGTGLTAAGVGIDMTGAGADVSIASAIVLGADQTWFLGTGRTLTITGAFTADATDDLIVSGAGTLSLGNTTDNSYSIGSVTLQNGAALVNTQDNAFGDTTTVINMNAGTFWDKGGFTDSFRGLTGTGTVTNAGNMDFRTLTGEVFTFSGSIAGPATADLIKQGQANLGTQVIAGDVSFQDQLLVYSGTLSLAGTDGAANQITGTLLMGRSDTTTVKEVNVPYATLRLDSSAGNHVAQNRLHDDEEVLFRSTGHLHMIGNSLAATTESVGPLNIAESNSVDSNAVITLEDGGAGVTLTSDSLIRSAGSTLLLRGSNLGTGPAGAGVARLLFDVTAPTITGTLGTPTAGIVPGVLGDTLLTGQGAGFVTYDVNGLRLLQASEMVSSFAGAGQNVRLVANQILGGNTNDLTANLAGSGVTLDLGGHALSLASASILSSGTAGGTITNGTINFGAATEGFIYTVNDLTLNATITGDISLTKAGTGTLNINQPQTYTGATSITAGTVNVGGSFILPASRLNVNGTLNLNGTGTYNRVQHISGSNLSTVNLNGNTLEMAGGASVDYYGQLVGTADSKLIKSGANTFSLRALNTTFLGDVIVRGGTFRILGDTSTSTSLLAGTLTGAKSFLVETGGTLTLENQLSTDSRGISNRIGDTASITLNRGTFVITGSNNARPVEVIGDLTLAGGYNTITLDADFGANTDTSTSHGDVVLTATRFLRTNFATGLIRGDNLGFAIGGVADETTAANTTGGNAGDPGGSESNFTITNGITLSSAGTGSAIGIVPYLTGGVSAGNGGASLVTYAAGNGFRLLDFSPTTTDYFFQAFAANAALSSASISGQNVYLDITANNSDPQLDGPATIGGLVIDNTGGTGADFFLQGHLLTVSGGIILSTGSQNNTISAGTVGGSITFGNNAATGYEGRIHGVRQIEINAPIVDNGPNAVSITTDGTVYYQVPQLYTGNTVINSGRLEVSGENLIPIAGVLTANGNGALRLFGGSQEIGGLQGTGFVENVSTTLVRTLTINTDNAADQFTFNGVLRDGAAMALNLVKKGPGTQIFSGEAGISTATGSVAVHEGLMVLDGGITNTSGQTFQDNRFAPNVPLILGQGALSSRVQIGGPSGALNQTVAELSSSGSGSANAIIGGNGTRSTFTVNQTSNTTFNGSLGGPGTFENNLNFVKNGGGSLTVTGTNSLNGTVNVNGGELVISGAGLLGSNVQRASVADGAKLFFQHGSTTQTFTGTGNVLTLGSTTGASIGFGINGATNDQINLTAGQTLTRNGTTLADIYVVGTPTLTSYTLINSAADGSFLGTGSFVAGTIFNPGNFIYNVTRESPDAGNNDRLILTLTAQAAPPDVWWKGDLGGTGTGVWSGSAIGGNTNWDSSQTGGIDAAVPPDSNSHVHFSANGAANFTTSLGADLTVKQVTFEAGSVTNGVTVGGTDKLTLTGASGIGFTLAQGNAGTVTVSAPVGIGAAQAWNVEDAAGTLAVLGGVSGTGSLNLNASPTATGTVILGGTSTYTGSTSIRAGRLGLTGTNPVPNGSTLTLGSATSGAVLQLGTTHGAANVTLGSLILGSFGSNDIVGGSTALSSLTLNLAVPLTLGIDIGGAGTNENNLSLIKKGVGTLILNGTNTYVGTTTINQGIVQLGTAGSSSGSTGLSIIADAGQTALLDINGRTMTLAGAITLGGGSSTSQADILDTATGGTLTLGGNITYDATNDPLGSTIAVDLEGSGGNRTITGNDSASATTDLTVSGDYIITTNNSLTLDGTGNNLFSGDITSDALFETTRDLNKVGAGTWTLSGDINIGDTLAINNGVLNLSGTSVQNDIIVTGATSVLNISGVIDGSAVSDTAANGLYVRTGGTINILAQNVIGSSLDFVLVNDNAAGTSTLNLNTFSFTTPRLDVGGASNTADRIGNVIGTGTINIGTIFNAYTGSVSANLASTVMGANSISKDSVGALVLSGNNAFGTGGTLVREGELILDFGTHSGTDNKIGTGTLTMGANLGEATPRLSLNGHGTVPATQSVAAIASARGAGNIGLVNNGAAVTLDVVGSITRTNNSTLNFDIGAGTQVKVGSMTLTEGIIGGWATVNHSAFATVSGGVITAFASTPGNDVDSWTAGQHVTNTAGFTNVVDQCVPNIASLSFNANAASTLTLDDYRSLAISTGGILITPNVGANNTAITGGRVTGPLIIHQNNTGGTFEISSDRDGALSKSGEGTLILSGNALSNTAAVTLNEGRLVLTGGNAIGDAAPVNIVGAVGAGATVLELAAGQTETIGVLQGGENGNGTVLLNAGSQLTLNQGDGDGTANENFVFGGVFSGTGTLVKTNIDFLTLTALSTDFTGAVVADLGRIDLQGASGRLSSATSYTINAGAEIIARQDQSGSTNRLADSAPITLNNTAGTVTVTGRNGLWSYNQNQNATRTENVGPINLGFGHNLIMSQGNTASGTGTSTVSDLVADTLTRGSQRSTLLVRGLALGTTTATQRGLIRFETSATATLEGYEVGGGGVSTPTVPATNISIIPWIIGQNDISGAGNTLVTHESAALGLRPLATGEYINDSAAVTGTTTNNIRYTASSAFTATPTAINALVFDSANAITLGGTAASMEVTSGALLFAGNGNHTISTISGLTTGGGRDYSIFTPGTGTVTLDPALTSPVPLVKSGAGTLRLTNVLNAFTSVYLNQGNIEISNIAALGTGTVNFAGGQLNLGTGYTGDLGGRIWNIGTGGGGINVNAINATATNLVLTGSAPFRKLGAGTLTLAGTATSTHTGLVTVAGGTLELNNSPGSSIGAGGLIVSSTIATTLRILANEQIADTAKVEMIQTSGVAHRFELNNFSETIGSLVVTSGSTTAAIVATGATGVLTVMGDIILNNNRVADSGTTEFQLLITGAGTATAGTRTVTGTLDLGGADRRIVVESNQTDTTFRNDATIETVIRNGGIIKEGSRTLYLRADNTYAGATTINQGRISIGSAANLGNGSVTNTIALNNGGTLRSTGTSVDLGVNRSIALGGSGGSLEVVSPNQLTASGIISGTDCAVLTKVGTGALFLSNANTYVGGTAINAGTLVVNNSTGSGTGTGTVTVGTGGILAGIGRISGLVTNNGTIDPGSINGSNVSTLGQLNIGSLSSTPDSILLFQIGGATTLDLAGVMEYQSNPNGFNVPASWTNYQAGSTLHDQLVINDPNAPALTTTIQISNLFLNGFVPDYGHVFQFLDWTSLGTTGATGTPTFNLPSLPGGLNWNTGLFNGYGIIVVVPEPSRLLLLFLGFLGLHLRRRR